MGRPFTHAIEKFPHAWPPRLYIVCIPTKSHPKYQAKIGKNHRSNTFNHIADAEQILQDFIDGKYYKEGKNLKE